MEYQVLVMLITEAQGVLSKLAAEGWQVHTMTLTGAAQLDGQSSDVPLFTFLFHRMTPQPQEQHPQEDDKPKAMAMR
jgi:hypothetical protein